MLTSLLSGERVPVTSFAPGQQMPSLLLHTVVSMMSAMVMLTLACFLRLQTGREHRRRAPVAQARPIMMAYGVVPTTEEVNTVDEVADRTPMAIGHRVGLSAATVADGTQPQVGADVEMAAAAAAPHPPSPTVMLREGTST